MEYADILKRLKSLSNPKNVEGMARFGIISKNVLGITKPVMDKIAKDIGKNHNLALRLWDSEVYEARVIAALIDEPALVTEKQMEDWVEDFDNWGVCDNTCSNLFDKTPFAYKKAKEWSSRSEEFVKRASFALVAALAVHDKKATDDDFIKFLPIIKKASIDERNFVRKAVNWALRQIGKRNLALNKEAIRTANDILEVDSKSARWIANDALKELKSDAVKRRLG
jgi:3-methyladenine DNA glycosylase AlkD